MFGSGTACLVLKRLTDALDHGDTIHAVIKGSAINNDGSLKVGYLAPGVEGQVDVIRDALDVKKVHAIGYCVAGTTMAATLAYLAGKDGKGVGENELEAIDTVQAYVDAQQLYASRDRDADGVLEYAQKLISTPGQTDGLYWPAGQGDGDERRVVVARAGSHDCQHGGRR